VRLSETAGGKVRVTFLDVPEAVAEADSKEEALYQAKFALEHSLGNYVLHGRPVPVPSDLPDAPAVTTDKFSAPEAPTGAEGAPEDAGDVSAAPSGARY
jgi:predicted RNase H-like HicB family nuclease